MVVDRVYYIGRDGEAFIGVVPPGNHGLSAPIDMDYWRQPSTMITPGIPTDTPPIERTDAPIIPHAPPGKQPKPLPTTQPASPAAAVRNRG
ncbi:hypothetical protein LCGC14_0093710 [marine sediment metagenome]|uniref:Uncharacterized protein n=1 Tax=marine sediment metagenome TaxID=412755 RepID=A0A0F9XVP6_9ZZZZ|nr:hypothetical protein [Phycisphaerae bacterium]HDZ44035.1 hypothetical protein [Phycisphaerae bacterium]